MSKTFDDSVRNVTLKKHQVLLGNFEQIAKVMHHHSQQRFLWTTSAEPRQLFNNYLDILWSVHVIKFNELCEGLIESVNRGHFLLYGLIGRSFIEHAGTMRYYIKERLQPTIDEAVQTGTVSVSQIQGMITELDRFLRGSRFDWNAFLTGDFDQLTKDISEELSMKRQVNILTCMQKWARETPSVTVLYNLFCDLVHPNIGSTLLVMKTWRGQAGFGGEDGQKVGQDIMIRTLAGLIGLFNDVQKYLNAMLILRMPIEDGPQNRSYH
jgi:hypothetical protein